MENYMITLQKIASINWADNSSKTQHASCTSIHIQLSIILAKLTKINYTFTTLTYKQMHYPQYLFLYSI